MAARTTTGSIRNNGRSRSQGRTALTALAYRLDPSRLAQVQAPDRCAVFRHFAWE